MHICTSYPHSLPLHACSNCNTGLLGMKEYSEPKIVIDKVCISTDEKILFYLLYLLLAHLAPRN